MLLISLKRLGTIDKNKPFFLDLAGFETLGMFQKM